MNNTILIPELKLNKPFIKFLFLALLVGSVVSISLYLIRENFAIWLIAILWMGALSSVLLSIRNQLIILWILLPFIDLIKRILYLDSLANTNQMYLVLATVDLILLTILLKDFMFSLQKPIKINLNAIDVFVILFGFFSFISAILVSNAPFIARFATVGMWIWPMVSYYLFGKYFNTKERLIPLEKLLLILGIIVAIYGIQQFYNGLFPFEAEWFQRAENSENVSSLQAYYVRRGVFRTFGTMDSHSSFGIFMGISLITAWILKPILNRSLWIIFSTILSIALLLSFTRFTYIMPIIAAILIFIFTFQRIQPLINLHKIRRTSWLLLGVVLSFFMFYFIMDNLYGNTFIPTFSNPYLRRMFGTGTLEARLRMDDFISQFAISDPLGSGLANSTFFASKFSFDSGDVNFHNIFLDMAGSMGIIGVLIFLSFIYFLIKLTLRKIKIEQDKISNRMLIGLFCLILAMLTVGHFNGAVHYFGRAIPIYFWAMCGILAHYKLEKPLDGSNIRQV